MKSEAANYPAGTLRVSVDNNKIRYYHCVDDKEGTQVSIHAKELKLAQKSYNEKLLKLAKKRCEQINLLLKDFDEFGADKLFDDLHPARKRLVVPIEVTFDGQFLVS